MIDFELMPHQKEVIKKSFEVGDLFLAADMGTGKTCAIIQVLRHLYSYHSGLQPTLVLAPLITLQNWKREFEMFSKIPQSAIHVLTGTGKKKYETLQKAMQFSCIAITNYETLDNDAIFELINTWGPKVLVLDEAHLVKSHKSKRAKRVAYIADRCSNRYLLTGTPILNNAMDLFMQFRILDGYLGPNSTFGSNFFVFRNQYFQDLNASFSSKPQYFPKWVPRPKAYDELKRRIQAKTILVNKKDVLKDLPDLVVEHRYVEMGAEQKRVYQEVKKEFVSFLQNQKGKDVAVIARLAIVKALRLQQIVSGFVNVGEGESVEAVHFKDVPRLEALKTLLQEITPEHKVIVWAAFKENYKQIAKVCEDLGVGYTELHGEVSNKDKFSNQDTFNKDPQCRVLIGNPGAGGVGINLVAASYMIYYSRGFKLGDDLQSEARNYRKGSEIHDKITRINIVAPKTIDELVAESLVRKENISEEVLKWKL
jgi:non-specific serine/threonine protein kinase